MPQWGLNAMSPSNTGDDTNERRRRQRKNNAAKTMEITAIPPMTPPMMAPRFEQCLPEVPINAGVVVLEKGPPKALVETEGSEGPSILPGPISGKTIKHMT
jgi:hypothetical protein